MHRLFAAFFPTIFALTLAVPAAANDHSLQFSSGEQQVALLELYTSEGCSSCPPADRWLSALKSAPGLWQDFVPIALHVDYWNYIGWDDRFAQRRFSDRQRDYVRGGAARVSYTPGFFSCGEEWLGWRQGEAPGGSQKNVGDLSLRVSDQTVAAHFSPVSDLGSEFVLNIAILGMQLETDVRAGENKGRTLTHDFVALHWQATLMRASENGFEATATLESVDAGAPNHAIVAWVAAKGDPTPLQAVGGYLAKKTATISRTSPLASATN